MARGAQQQGYELVPGSVVPRPQPAEAGSGEASAQQEAPVFVLAGAECGRGEQHGPCAPCPVDTSPVSAPPAAPRRSRACRTPHAEWRRRRQGPARPRAWGRGAGRALPPPPARPPAGGSHRRARTRQMSTACLMSESSGTGSREGAARGAGVQRPWEAAAEPGSSSSVPPRRFLAAAASGFRSGSFRASRSGAGSRAGAGCRAVPVPEAGSLRLRRSGSGEPPSGVPPACSRPGRAPAPRRQHGASPVPAFAPAAGRWRPHSLPRCPIPSLSVCALNSVLNSFPARLLEPTLLDLSPRRTSKANTPNH